MTSFLNRDQDPDCSIPADAARTVYGLLQFSTRYEYLMTRVDQPLTAWAQSTLSTRRGRLATPSAKHAPPFTWSEDLRLPERLDLGFALNASRRKLVPRWSIEGTEEDIPKREYRSKILIVMVREAAVVDSVNLR